MAGEKENLIEIKNKLNQLKETLKIYKAQHFDQYGYVKIQPSIEEAQVEILK